MVCHWALVVVGLVRLALRRPYTFIVMALLIMIFGVASAFRTPTDIFPDINIPVVSVVFSYTGLPPDDMAGRILTFYERALTTTVNDIEHIESQSIPRYGRITIVVNALSNQNLITPVGTQKIGTFEYTVNLNASPSDIAAFNDLPIKTVNGTVVYMRDVADVHDGSPPQTNVVHVDGKNAVLLAVIKAGAVSTLSVISGIKQLLPSVTKTLPSGLNLTAVRDQSGFVTSAVSSAGREAVIAAALTGLMILLFLGNWRSTLIVSISIPLAILASLTVLSVLGETINVMTLGGLALAVGILVDEKCQSTENINRHLESGEEIESSILHGAQEIVVPASISLMSIRLAFVPMFGLGGVAGYLFRPLAEAVVFALIASYILSCTLVPTLANYLLRGQAHEATTGPSRNPLVRFQQGFERRFEAIRSGYGGLLVLGLRNRGKLIAGFVGFSLLSFGLAPFLGQDFFPTVDGGQIKMHVRAQNGTDHRGNA